MGTLRFILASSVVIWHSGTIFGWRPFNGTACVNYFFVISGFYMTLILTSKYAGRDQLMLFWSNRALRLWPSFFFVSVLVVILKFDELAAAYTQLDLTSAISAIAMNLTMIGYEFFDLMSVDSSGTLYTNLNSHDARSARDFVLLGQGWSIGLEIWFYILAPFVVTSPRRTAIWLALGLALFVVSNYWVQNETWKYRFFPNIMVFFAVGVLSFHLRRIYYNSPLREKLDVVATRVLLPFSLILLLFPDLMGLILPERHHLKFLLLIALPCIPIWFEATRKLRWDRLLGELSYPVYLNHLLVLTVVGPFLQGPVLENSLRSIVVLPVSTLMAYAMVKLIEQPVDGWRQKRVRAIKSPGATPISGS